MLHIKFHSTIICAFFVSTVALGDNGIVSVGDCDYQIISKEPKQVSLYNGKRVDSADFVVPSTIHLTPESNKIHDVTWTGFSTTAQTGTFDGQHSYSLSGSSTKKTITCKFRAKGSVTFKISAKVPVNTNYRSYVEMFYDSKSVASYHDYSLSSNSYSYKSDVYTVTPGDGEEHTLSFCVYLAHYKESISVNVSIVPNDDIEEGDYTVAQIGQKAFEGCASLQTITLLENISSVNSDIFSGCDVNTIISYNETPPTASFETFNGVDKENTKIYVPSSSIELYKNAEGWKDFIQRLSVL